MSVSPPQRSLRDSYDSGFQSNRERLTWFSLSRSSVGVEPGQFDTDSYDTNRFRIAIILGYYNGKAYLSEQLRSILDQSHRNLDIFISDDCSDLAIGTTDLTFASLDTKGIHLGTRTSNIGVTNNFLDALSSIDASFEYFAFSDQDDVWYRDKLQDALSVLERYPQDQPALYCARTIITDETCQATLGASPLFTRPPSFTNALVQNIGGGNTMVFNKAARNLIVTSTAGTDIVSHDWWCYQIVAGAGGTVYYDQKPCLKYRQHSDNLIGSNNSWTSRFMRIRGLLQGKFRHWNDTNIAALVKNRALLTAESQRCLDYFTTARQSGLMKRLLLFRRSGIYRQTFWGNLGLFVGILMNKI